MTVHAFRWLGWSSIAIALLLPTGAARAQTFTDSRMCNPMKLRGANVPSSQAKHEYEFEGYCEFATGKLVVYGRIKSIYDPTTRHALESTELRWIDDPSRWMRASVQWKCRTDPFIRDTRNTRDPACELLNFSGQDLLTGAPPNPFSQWQADADEVRRNVRNNDPYPWEALKDIARPARPRNVVGALRTDGVRLSWDRSSEDVTFHVDRLHWPGPAGFAQVRSTPSSRSTQVPRVANKGTNGSSPSEQQAMQRPQTSPIQLYDPGTYVYGSGVPLVPVSGPGCVDSSNSSTGADTKICAVDDPKDYSGSSRGGLLRRTISRSAQ